MGRARYANADFIDAARALAAQHGPAAVTVGSVTARLKAPIGSFYYRFGSRDLLLGELWLRAATDFQMGFLDALAAGDGLGAALHTPLWSRTHLDDAQLLLLYSRRDFVQGDWPKPLKEGVRAQAERFKAALEQFARESFGSAGAEPLGRAQFLLVDLPHAAVRPYLRRRETPPPLVDDLIRTTYRAVIETASAASR